MRLPAAEGAKTLNAAGNSLPSASSTQLAVVAAVGPRGNAPRDIGYNELELIYSCESDGGTDSTRTAANTARSG